MRIVNCSIFEARTQTIVNTVNCVGVMGKGIALEVKRRFPKVYEDYLRACKRREIRIGKLDLSKRYRVWVLNFPTKAHWRGKSKLKYVEEGLKTFAANYRKWGIKSIAFPKLGCGQGGLHWNEVEPLMRKYLVRLKGVKVLVCVAEPRVSPPRKARSRKIETGNKGAQLAFEWSVSRTKE